MFWKKNKEDAQSAWKVQNEEQNSNPCYRFINLQKGGLLVEVFEHQGPQALEETLQRKLEQCLYNHGAGGIIKKVDHIRWKNQASAKLNVRV